MTDEDLIGDRIVAELSLCTLPIRALATRKASPAGTAFLYNELVESGPDGDRVREWILTADHLTRMPYGEVRLRPEMIEGEPAADFLAVAGFADLWQRDRGAAVTSSALLLDQNAERRGYRWRTQQVTHGWAASPEFLRGIGPEAVPAWTLGHLVVPEPTDEQRPQAISRSTIARDPDRVIRWRGDLNEGFAGAPVFTFDRIETRSFRLLCIGLLADGGRNPAVITFDTLRTLIDSRVARTARQSGRS